MPIYTVEYNGKVYDLEAPAGTTPEQLMAALEGQTAPGAGQGAGQPAQNAPGGQERPQKAVDYATSARQGVADAAIRAGIGFNQLNDLGFRSPLALAIRTRLGLKPRDTSEEQAVLREQQADYEADPNKKTRIAGNIAGNVLLTALPLAKLAGPSAQGVNPLVAAGTTGGALGAVLSPGEGETPEEQTTSKMKQAAFDAAISGGMSGAGQALKKTLTGMFKPTPEAVNLMKEGVNPTLAQGAEGLPGRTIGKLTSGIADVSGRQNKEVMQAFLKRTAPEIDTSDMTVTEIKKLLKVYFQGDEQQLGEYGKLLAGKKFTLSRSSREAVWKEAGGAAQPEAQEMALAQMGKTGSAMTANNVIRMKGEKLAEYRALMQDAIDAFDANGGVMEKQARQALSNARKVFDQLVRDPQLSQAEKAALRDIDQRYTDFLAFSEAAKTPGFHVKPSVNALQKAYAARNPEGFSSGNISRTQSELVEPAARNMGLIPNQDQSRTLLTTMTRIGKGALGAGAIATSPYMAAPYALSALGQTAPGARFLFGQQAWQKPTAEEIEKLMPLLYGSGFIGSGEK